MKKTHELRRKLIAWFVVLSMILSPSADILSKVLSLPGDPLLYGMTVSLLVCLAGYFRNKKRAE